MAPSTGLPRISSREPSPNQTSGPPTSPPQVVEGHEEVVRQVAARPGAIGYIQRAQLDKRVIVVHVFGE